jgi:pyruvate/2-oxoglutarate/acetoin dehydrogenase E1 component
MPSSQTLTYGGAINAALTRVMHELPETILFGEDVAKPGGVFGVTRGLHREFGDRVFDTPISESAILGAALGAAMMGRRPIVEIMWADFFLVAMDQVVNQIANARYLSRGAAPAPLVIRTQQGMGPGACAQHSQSLEAFFLHTPGLRVVMPTLPQDAYDGIVSAAFSNDPVIVIENRYLYPGDKAPVSVGGPPRPPGGSTIRRSGDDVTALAWGPITRTVEAAADEARTYGIGVDVIEATWLNPLDIDAIQASVERTGRIVVVHEANRTGGFGGEIIAQLLERGVRLAQPPRRVALPDVRVPAAPSLLAGVAPGREHILRALVGA